MRRPERTNCHKLLVIGRDPNFKPSREHWYLWVVSTVIKVYGITVGG